MGLVLTVAACLGGGPAASELTTAQAQKDVKRALLGSSEHRMGWMPGQGEQESQGHPLGCLGWPGGNEMDIWEREATENEGAHWEAF